MIREAGIDWTEVERLTSDRKGWKEKVAERMEHLDIWGVREEGDRRQCGGCRRWVSRANYDKHVRVCGRVEAGGRDVGVGVRREGQVRMVTCRGCGKEMRAGYLARHQRGACRVWDPGGGQTTDGGRWPT